MEFLRLLSCADAFTPISHMLQDWIRGDVQRFEVDSYDALEYRSRLKKSGVLSWGWYYYAPTRKVVFSVKKRHTKLVRLLCDF